MQAKNLRDERNQSDRQRAGCPLSRHFERGMASVGERTRVDTAFRLTDNDRGALTCGSSELQGARHGGPVVGDVGVRGCVRVRVLVVMGT